MSHVVGGTEKAHSGGLWSFTVATLDSSEQNLPMPAFELEIKRSR